MRKKFFAMYALVGALVASPVFTSCIENEESPTVSAVRNAKAEQLKAAAALAQAQTEMAKAKTEAEIALLNAQKEGQELANNAALTRLEAVKLETEKNIAYYQYQIELYKQQLYQYQDQVLTELTGNYTGALDNIATYNLQIVHKEADKAKLERGLVDVKEWIKSETTRLNNAIATAEATIEALKKAEGYDNSDLKAKSAELQAELDLVGKEINGLTAKYGSLNYSSQEKEIKLATVLAAKKLLGESNGTSFIVNTQSYNKYFVMTDANGYLVLNQRNVEAYKLHIAENLNNPNPSDWSYIIDDNNSLDIKRAEEELALAIAKLGTEADKKDTKYVYGTHPTTFEDLKALTKYAELAAAKEDLTAKEKTYKEKKEAYDKAKATKAEKANALTKAQDDLAANTDATKVQTLTDAVTAAQTAYNTADTAFGTAEAAYLPTVQPYEDAVTAVENAEIAVAQGKDAINGCELILNKVKENVEKANNFETWVAAFEGEDYEAYKAAKDEIDAATTKQSDLTTEKGAVDALIYNNLNIKELIATQEANIEGYKNDLATLTSQGYMTLPNGDQYNSETHDKYTEADIEALIAMIDKQIAVLKTKIELEEIRAEQAKAALDAYLAEGGDVESGEAEEA